MFIYVFVLQCREVHKEVNQAREKVRGKIAMHREKLKQAYLRKRLEKIKASETEQNSRSI